MLSLNERLLGDYLGGPGPYCLQLGTGYNVLPGWLNSDLNRNNDATLTLDVTEPFAIPDAIFDYIQCEHMIEHITLEQGATMLAECARVLKPGGVVRIATPSIGFLMRLMCGDHSGLEKRYIQWTWESNFGGTGVPNMAVILNGFMRAWGHQFIYDHKTLRAQMERAGFDVVECRISQSQHEALRGLEHVSRMEQGFLELESMIYEGTNPDNLVQRG